MLAYDLLVQKIRQYQSKETDARTKRRLANELVKMNEPLCATKAKNFLAPGVEWDDLMNEARRGIAKAIDLFDLDSGYRFSTYACVWINKYLLLATDSNRLIYLPDSAQRVYRKAKKLLDNGVSDIDEISKTLKLNSKYVHDCLDMSRDVMQIPCTQEGVPIDFADTTSTESGTPLLQLALSQLDLFDVDICIKRSCGWTFPEIASFLGSTTKTVRQAYNQAIKTLKASLEPFYAESSVEVSVDTPVPSIEPQGVEIPTAIPSRTPLFYTSVRSTAVSLASRLKTIVFSLDDSTPPFSVSPQATQESLTPIPHCKYSSKLNRFRSLISRLFGHGFRAQHSSPFWDSC